MRSVHDVGGLDFGAVPLEHHDMETWEKRSNAVANALRQKHLATLDEQRRHVEPRLPRGHAAPGPAPPPADRRSVMIRYFLCALAILAAAVPPAFAQAWPQKPVRVIVPFPPGGVTDGIARIAADWLGGRLGQPVIAENRPGASGAIAAEFVARSAPDGYTLFAAATPQLAIVPHVQKIPYDPVKDFAPISIVGSNAFALGVNDAIPARTLPEFVAYVKARPGQLNFASAGSGTVGHLTMSLFLARAGLDMQAVLYKGGGPAMADVVAGHVPAYFGNLNELIPHSKSGRVKVIAVSGESRAAQLPDVPTVAEQGYPGFRTVTWNGLVAPAGTPAEVIDRVAREVGAACKDASFAERLTKIGVEPVCSSPAEFSQAVRQDLELWKDAVRAAGIRPPQ